MLTFCASLMLCGCAKVIYTVHDTPYVLPHPAGEVTIDTSYDLFVRTVSIEETHPRPAKKAGIRTLKVNQAALKSTAGTDRKLIEIEYLFLSYSQGYGHLYFDRGRPLAKNATPAPDFPGIMQPNVADFRVFLVGTVDPGNLEKFTFYYPDHQHTDTWRLHKDKRTGDPAAL